MFRLWMLRIGFCVIFATLGIMAFLTPEAWVSFIPSFALKLTGLSSDTLLYVLAGLEVAIALMMLFWSFARFGFALAILVLILLVGTEIAHRAWDIAARDFALLTAATYGAWRSMIL